LGKLVLALLCTIYLGGAFAQEEVNLLKNPEFEARTAQWAKTGASTFIIETVAPIAGAYSAKWNPSASGEFFRSSTYAIPAGLKGKTCAIQMAYIWDAGVAGEILMNVDDGTNNIATLSLEPTVGSVTRTAQATFTCPTSGSIRFELESTANAAEITLDKTFLGGGRNTIQISQAQMWAGLKASACAEMTTTSGTVTELPVSSGCALSNVGQATVVANDFRLRMSSLPKGRYHVAATLPLHARSSNGTQCELYMHIVDIATPGSGLGYGQSAQVDAVADGPNFGFTYQGWFDNTVDRGTTDVFFRWRRVSGAGICSINIGAAGNPSHITVLKYPQQAAEALNLDTTGWFFDGNIGGANPNLGLATVSSYTQTTDAGLDLVLNSGSASGRIPCTGSQAATGLTCSTGSEIVGVTVDLPHAGLYKSCFDFGYSPAIGSGGTVAAIFQIVRTADASLTIVEEGKSRVESSVSINSSAGAIEHPYHICGTFNVPSAGTHSFKLYHEQAVSGSVTQSLVLADRAGANGQRDIHITIMPLNQQLPAPVFTGSQKG
jgi:hypothetical protein